jgi:signal transduction histidine kinase
LTGRDKKPRSRPSDVNARLTSPSRIRGSGAFSKVVISERPPPPAPAQAVHDLRDMLHVICACAEAATRDLVPGSDTHENLVDLRAAAGRATKIVEALALAPGVAIDAPAPLDVNGAISNFLQVLQRQAGSRAEVVLDAAPGELRAAIEPHSLDHALLNLVVNAVDAIGRGGVITIRTEAAGELVRIIVSDTGTGMDAATLARAFDVRFTTRAAIGRRGMGLATVRRLVDTIGGSVSVTSVPGIGTDVTMQLPACKGRPS